MFSFKPLVAFVVVATFSALAYASDNGSNDYLLSLSKPGQADMLGKVVGEGCKGQTPFYKGTGNSGISKGLAYWDVRCTDGRTYEVEVHPDGTSRVLECSLLENMHAGHCFQKFPQ